MRAPAIGLFATLSACAGFDTEAAHAHVGPVTSLAFTPRGLASCSQGGVFVDAQPATETFLPLRPLALAALPGSGDLLVVGGRPGQRGEIALVQPARVSAQRLARDLLYCVTVSPDGTRAATGGADGCVRVLGLQTVGVDPPLDITETASHAHHTGPCRAVAFTPDGKTLVSVGLDGLVVVRELLDDTFQRLTDHTAGVECLAIRADGARIASGARDGKVRIHARDGRLLRTFARLGDTVLALAWRDEQTLLAGLGDGQVLALTDAGEGAQSVVARFEVAVHSLAIGPDGGLAIGLQDGRVVRMP